MTKKIGVITVLFVFILVASGPAFASNSNAYINLEVKKVNKIYQELQKISADNKIIANSYSENTNSKNKKKSINVSYEISKSQVIILMTKIASLGEVKSQNYRDSRSESGSIESKTKMLEYYKTQLDKTVASQTEIPEVVSQLNYKIQSLEKEIAEYEKQNQEGYDPKVSLNIQIKEYGYENDDTGRTVTINLLLFIGVIVAVAVLSVILGIFIGWIIIKKNKPVPENI